MFWGAKSREGGEIHAQYFPLGRTPVYLSKKDAVKFISFLFSLDIYTYYFRAKQINFDLNPVMHSTLTSILLILPSIFSTSTSAQGLTQNQTCANACTAAQACDHQCAPGTGYDPYANTNIFIACLCQKGCLCNAEICLQCCDAAGGAGNYDPVLGLAFSCGLAQLGAGNVVDVCSVVSRLIFYSRARDRSRGGDGGGIPKVVCPCY